MAFAFRNNSFRKIEIIEYKWMIHEFSSYNLNSGLHFETPEIYGKDNNYKYSLQLYPNVDKYEQGFLSTYVKIVPLKIPYLSASFSVSILDSLGNQTEIIYTTQFYDFHQNSAWGFDDFLPISKVFYYLHNDILTFLFEINILHPSLIETNQKYIANTMKVIAPEISKRKADVLFSVEGMLFYAHRDILASKSEYFKTMLKKLKRRDTCPIFHLNDITCHLFAILIHYMYTGMFDDVEQNADKILKSADKYEIVGLKQYCEDILIKTVNVDNIVELYTMSEKYRASKLRNYALQFIMYNASEIIKSQAWHYFINRPSLASIIHGAVMSKNVKW